MKKTMICLVGVLVFFVMGGAGAVSQNITLGPCNVTFDLGFDEPINGTYAEVVHSETYSGTKFNQYEFESLDNMSVGIRVFVDPDERWGYRSTEDFEDRLSLARTDDVYTRFFPREFDGNTGHIFVIESAGFDDVVYAARYNALNDTVDVYVLSAYPWDEGTTNLLNSIHIEKVA